LGGGVLFLPQLGEGVRNRRMRKGGRRRFDSHTAPSRNRYQLTAVGSPGPNLYIAMKIADIQFKIAGGAPWAEVSWMVTGIRKDAWAEAHRIPVEEDKPSAEQGYYIHPQLYGQPEEKGIEWALHPEKMNRMKEQREAQKVASSNVGGVQ